MITGMQGKRITLDAGCQDQFLDAGWFPRLRPKVMHCSTHKLKT